MDIEIPSRLSAAQLSRGRQLPGKLSNIQQLPEIPGLAPAETG